MEQGALGVVWEDPATHVFEWGASSTTHIRETSMAGLPCTIWPTSDGNEVSQVGWISA